MAFPYELWDYELGNLVYAYETQEEAIEDIRTMIHAYGPDAARMWVLQFDDRTSPLRNIAIGDNLVQLALAPQNRSVAD